MTWNHLSFLFALLGAACLGAAWFRRRSDDARDTLMLTVVGGGKVVLAMGLWVMAAQA